MKKQFLLLLTCILATLNLAAQTVLGTIFNQNGTQRKYYLQQIAALAVYAKDIKSGYKIVSGGLATIHDAKNGEFNLHRQYFSSLSSVNTGIKSSGKVQAITNYQQDIEQCLGHMLSVSRRSSVLSGEDKAYLQSVADHMRASCISDLDDLSMLITDDRVQMKDDERIRRIDRIYSDMQDKDVFSRRFASQAIQLSNQKAAHHKELAGLKQLYNLKN